EPLAEQVELELASDRLSSGHQHLLVSEKRDADSVPRRWSLRFEGPPESRSAVAGHDRRVCEAHLSTSCPIEHPPGQFKRPPRLVLLEPAPRHRTVASLDLFDDNHPPSEPRMPGVMHLTRFGTVGLLSCCWTTRSVPISPWAIGRRLRSIEPGFAEPDSVE